MSNQQPRPYPPGALVRVQDICRHHKTGRPGLLPINRSTWHRWIKEGRVPEGTLLAGSNLRVWPIDLVLSLASVTTQPADQSDQPEAAKPAAFA